MSDYSFWGDNMKDRARREAEREPREDREAQRYSPREDDYARLSALAGLDPDGCILPPPPGATIHRMPISFWRNPAGVNCDRPPSPGDECQCEGCRR